ncbi:hypothetical protein [Actinomadura sp. 3N407]|uniref:hypothetical protein n=1 Tax=Actinomadura sp. 3N407 TaxID=3457423 RepID=UPI003FCE2F6B
MPSLRQVRLHLADEAIELWEKTEAEPGRSRPAAGVFAKEAVQHLAAPLDGQGHDEPCP